MTIGQINNDFSVFMIYKKIFSMFNQYYYLKILPFEPSV